MARTQTANRTRASLERLAGACGIFTSFHSGLTGLTHASDESLLLTLAMLGIELSKPGDADGALAELLSQRAARRVEPVIIVWKGSRATAELRLPATRSGKPSARPGRARIEIVTEDDNRYAHHVDVSDLKPVSRRQADGSPAWFAKLPIAPAGVRLASGYHDLRITHKGETFSSRLIIAPKVSYQHASVDRRGGPRELGLFCPTYAIRSRSNLGIGNLTDLGRIGDWAAAHGAPVLGTLPLLACFLGDKRLFGFSPYSPVSRLFFNELFLDPTRAPGFDACDAAKRRVSSATFERRAAALRSEKVLVDYRASYRLLRPVLDALAASFFTGGGHRSEAFTAFLRTNPQAEAYARFRAACEHLDRSWTEWPKAAREGRLTASTHNPAVARTHLYAQFALREQLHGLSSQLESHGGGLYLDLAVGSHPDGYDVWANPGLFMPGSSVGAPPDPTYTEGQDWGFPAMHPERARDDGYRYFIDSLRAQMDIAGSLRLDHVMALHRLFCVPSGHRAGDGVYVGYREEELFAILSLESHRNRCRVFGENLGTVPQAIEKAMTRGRVGKMWIGQFSMTGDAKRGVRPIEANCVASLNTHDMPPLKRFFQATDVAERVRLKVFNAELADGEREGRKRAVRPTTAFLRKHAMLKSRGTIPLDELGQGLNRYLASSEAELVLVNIEDLWGETRMQNVPGTTNQHPNWRHKLRKTLEALERDTQTGDRLEELAERRAKPALKITKA
ncbi:MAG: 4-alpha-glucanotransferase [Planctomycetota bacterium]